MTHRLFAKHFQVAYIVEDIERGMGFFRDRFGVAKWHILDTAGPESPATAIAIAYVDELMLELIQPSAIPSIYRDWVPHGGSGVRLHHLGFLVHSDEDWSAALRKLAEDGYAEAFSGSAGDMLDFHYADCTADLGHYYELIHLKPAGAALFGAAPHN